MLEDTPQLHTNRPSLTQEDKQIEVPPEMIHVSYRDLAPETSFASALGLRLGFSDLHDASFTFLDLDLALAKCPSRGKEWRKTYLSH
jgi:hypothetical protein